MATSLSESFNDLCRQFILREEMDYSPPEFGQNVQKRDYKQLLQVSSKLSQFHRNALQSGTWPAASKSSSSLVATKPAVDTAPLNPQDNDIESLVTALVSRLSTNLTKEINLTSPRSPTTRYFPSAQYPCSNCGATNHWHRECPHPRQTPRRDSRPDSRSRPRSTSRSRPDSRPRSHTPVRRNHGRPSSCSNSRDAPRGRPILCNQTPGQTRDGSRDRSIAFDASAHNATVLAPPAPSAADLLRSINGRSSNY
jgi:hypothetical protein